MKFTYPPEAKPVDGYTIRRGICRGGFGEVYYAVSDAGKEVALKLLTHDRDTELRGIRQCLNLKHPNLLTIYDVKTDDEGDHWVVMEYVHGASLDDVLATYPRGLPLAEVQEWLAGLCAGVAYLHERGIVHRDLKPSNVYRENGVVKVGDIGLSKCMANDHHREHTASIGTVYYMAPEVARGQYGPEVDIYSLAVISYEMITGRLPFDGETTAEILMKHLSQAPNLSPLPAAVRPVLAKALAKDPRQRTCQVREFERAMQAALSAAMAHQEGAPDKPAILPESAFLSQSSRPVSCAQDTLRPNRPSAQTLTTTGASPTAPHPQAPKQAVPRKSFTRPKPQTINRSTSDWTSWLPWALLVFVLFVPWTSLAWRDIGEILAMLGLWTVLLYGLAWWCNPAALDRVANLFGRRKGEEQLTVHRSLVEQISCSLLLGAVLAPGLTLTTLWSMDRIDPGWLGKVNPGLLGFMASVSAVLAIVLLVYGQLLHAVSNPMLVSRSVLFALGAGSGGIAYALDDFLWVDFPYLEAASKSMFNKLGVHPLWVNHQPSLLAYMVFFAGLLGLQNWRKMLHPYRSQRLRFWSVVYAGILGWLISLLFGVPRPYAVVWAVTITTTVQLAAPWYAGFKTQQTRFQHT